jgi:hypothetical protein
MTVRFFQSNNKDLPWNLQNWYGNGCCWVDLDLDKNELVIVERVDANYYFSTGE